MESSLRPTVITLGGNAPIAVSFEEAFGEYSNLGGRHAAKKAARVEKRQAAKRKRIAARTETKVLKQQAKQAKTAAKQERRAAKKQGHQQNKLQKRVNRVNIRQQAQQARLQKRANAKSARQTAAPSEETQMDDESQLQQPLQSEEQQYQDDNSQYQDDTSEDGYADDQGYGDESGSEDYSQDEASPEDDGSGDENYTDDISDYESGLFMADGSSVPVEPYPFYEYENADGEKVKEPIHKSVQEMTNKIEWNREKVCRLVEQLNETEADALRKELEDKINHHKGRVIELISKIDGFANFDGEDESSANGKARVRKRKAHTSAAMRESKKLRVKGRRAKAETQKNAGKNFVKVEMGLNPKIEDNKLVIPASEKSSFDGGAVKSAISKINIPYAVAGVGLAALVIFGIKKMKLA